MAKVWQTSDVAAGDDITHTQYNNLRLDVIDAYENSSPIGTILMWAGSDANVPDGWKLCNGSAISRTTYSDLYTLTGNAFGAGNGSTTFNLPDMRDRFVVGAGSTYSVNGKGGSTSVTLTTANLASHRHTGPSHRHTGPSHTHSFSATSGNNNRTHTHSSSSNTTGGHSHGPAGTGSHFNTNLGGTMAMYSGSGSYWATHRTSSTTTNGSHSHSISTGNNNRTHTHSVSGTTGSGGTGNTGYQGTGNTGSTGSASAHENRPPYIGILYIIKVSGD